MTPTPPNIYSRAESDYPLYFTFDGAVFRLARRTAHFELRDGGEWKRVSLSEQDFLHLREIDEHEALVLSR